MLPSLNLLPGLLSQQELDSCVASQQGKPNRQLEELMHSHPEQT
jgi:hypothetical protein